MIFGNTKKLADLKNERDQSYSVSDQLTAKKNAERNRRRQILKHNKLTTGEKLKISFEKKELRVEGAPYAKEIHPPSCREVLMASKEQRLERMNMKLDASRQVKVQGQLFTAYTVAVRNLQEVNLAYGKLRTIHPDARHITGACRLPHRLFHTHCDFFDDEEHNAGAFILNIMEASDIQNRAIFVVRVYDGTHIGNARFDAMKTAIRSALDKAGANRITGAFDYIWDGKPVGNSGVRGRGRGGRGANNRGSSRGTYKNFPQLIGSDIQDRDQEPGTLEELNGPGNRPVMISV